MELDEKAILSLYHQADPVGVLSIFLSMTPEGTAHPKPAPAIALRNRLRDLHRKLKDEWPHPGWRAFERRLETVSGDFVEILDPARHGRGRALFVWIDDGRVEKVFIQMPFPEVVRVGERPSIRPLVETYDEGRAAGIIAIHQRGIRIAEWRLGIAADVGSFQFDESEAEDWRELRGPPGRGSPVLTQGAAHRDRFEHRMDENRLRFLKHSARAAGEMVREGSWDRLVVAGDPLLADAFVAALPELANHPEIVVTESVWQTEPLPVIAEAALPLLQELQSRRELALVRRAVDRALSGGPGAVGADKVLTALNEGRVDHLLFQSGLELDGYRTEKGLLFRRPEGANDPIREPDLLERAIERVFATGAKVTPVESEASQLLGEHEGLAAILRW